MTKGRNSDPIATIDVRCDDIDVGGAADLERAIAETGYGTFNVLLLVAALPVAWSGIFDTTTTAFVLISIECDLGATTLRKGVLASMPFLGMILGNVIWDRANPCVATRNLFILSLLADAALNVVSSAIDSYHAFLAIKFLTGILVAGPFSMVMQYLSEFHSAKYKASFARWAGLAVNAAIILPAALAFSIVPLSLDVEIFYRRYNSWRIYLLICSMVPLIGILTTSTLPHSPKYLVEIGRPDEALNLLRRMYSVNRWKSADTFPIETLLGSRTARASRRSFFKENSERLRLACYNTKVLFSAPYLAGVSRLGFLQFGSSLAFHTMRLWVPHTFMIISNFNGDAWTEDRPPLLADLLDRRNSLAMKDYVRCPNLYDVCAMVRSLAAIPAGTVSNRVSVSVDGEQSDLYEIDHYRVLDRGRRVPRRNGNQHRVPKKDGAACRLSDTGGQRPRPELGPGSTEHTDARSRHYRRRESRQQRRGPSQRPSGPRPLEDHQRYRPFEPSQRGSYPRQLHLFSPNRQAACRSVRRYRCLDARLLRFVVRPTGTYKSTENGRRQLRVTRCRAKGRPGYPHSQSRVQPVFHF